MSDIPELIEPIEVTFNLLNKETTLYSDGLSGRREPYNYVDRTEVKTIQAQVAFGNREQITAN